METAKTSIAYIDDKRDNLEVIAQVMDQNFKVETFENPIQFIQRYTTSNYAAILVDIHMPEMDGFKLYESVIQDEHYNGCPIIFVSSDDSESARIKSFAIGAVDFLNRSMRPEEMVARVVSKIQFYQKHRSIIEFGNLRVNLTLLKAFVGKDELKLTFIEFKLLCLALRLYPDLLTKELLQEQVWSNGTVLDATIHTHVSNLNSKLALWDHELVAVRAKGLQLAKKNQC